MIQEIGHKLWCMCFSKSEFRTVERDKDGNGAIYISEPGCQRTHDAKRDLLLKDQLSCKCDFLGDSFFHGRIRRPAPKILDDGLGLVTFWASSKKKAPNK